MYAQSLMQSPRLLRTTQMQLTPEWGHRCMMCLSHIRRCSQDRCPRRRWEHGTARILLLNLIQAFHHGCTQTAVRGMLAMAPRRTDPRRKVAGSNLTCRNSTCTRKQHQITGGQASQYMILMHLAMRNLRSFYMCGGLVGVGIDGEARNK